MEKFNFTERFKRMKRYFRRTSKEDVIILLNQAMHELSEIERRTDEIWLHASNGLKAKKNRIYLDLIGEELDRISESVESVKTLLNKAKENIRVSHRKEYEIELWI